MGLQLLLIALLGAAVLGANAVNGAAIASGATQNTERNIFASEVYDAVATNKLNENIVISPAAIQISMALAYYGARGNTATEMQSGLRLGSSNADEVVRRFGEFQQTFARDNYIRLFNNIYINENLEFKGKFKEIAQRNFESTVEKADFHPPYNKRTAERINRDIEIKTNGKITNVIQPQQLDDRTEGVIANAITFSAPWQKAFKSDKTKKRTFSSGGRASFEVDTMWTLNNFNYGDVSELDAKVVELPYQNADYSMIVLLPNKKDGLQNLLQRLSHKNLLQVVGSQLSSQKVEVHLPKFSVGFDLNLQEPFQKLGVTTMFTRQGDFGNLFRMFVNHYINSASHKAYVEVSEEGTEPSMESSGLTGLFSRSKKFEANHPFVFAIKKQDSVLFMGHISNYAYV